MKEVTMEQLLAGAILRFKKVDQLDLTLLIEVLKESKIRINQESDINTDFLDYIEVNGGVYSLRSGFKMDTEIADNYTVQHEIENIATTEVLNVLFNMDVDLFTLRKISALNPKVKAIGALFNDREKESIAKLKSKFMVSEYWSGPTVCDEELTLYVTKKGQVTLFMHDNPEFMAQITEIFNSLRFDISLLPMYLERKNLDVMNLKVDMDFIKDFTAFCSEQDLAWELGGTRK